MKEKQLNCLYLKRLTSHGDFYLSDHQLGPGSFHETHKKLWLCSNPSRKEIIFSLKKKKIKLIYYRQLNFV